MMLYGNEKRVGQQLKHHGGYSVHIMLSVLYSSLIPNVVCWVIDIKIIIL